MKKKELNKKQYMIIIISVIVLFLIIGLITFLVIHNSNSSKLKRYLISEEYKCNKTSCVKENYTVIYQINYHNGVLLASSPLYESINFFSSGNSFSRLTSFSIFKSESIREPKYASAKVNLPFAKKNLPPLFALTFFKYFSS